MKFGFGQQPRLEDDYLVKGRGEFSADYKFENQSYAVVFRSPYSCGKITRLDVTDAAQSEGVLTIITSKDLEAGNIGDLPASDLTVEASGITLESFSKKKQPLLAKDSITHVGQGIAFVVAKTKDLALDACEKIILEVEDQEPVINMKDAINNNSRKVFEECSSNLAFDWQFGNKEKVVEAYHKSKYKFNFELINNRVIANSIENRNATAYFSDNRYHLFCPTQGSVRMRESIAKNILKIDPKKLRVVSKDVGGGFGTRMFVYPEYALVLIAAKQTNGAVCWQGERSSDDLLSDLHGRDHITNIKISFDENHKITSFQTDTLANMGGYLSYFGAFIPTMAPFKILTGVYDIANFQTRVRGVYTNTTPLDAYRGAGRPEANYALERAFSHAANKMKISQGELRSKNLISKQQIPYTTPTGSVYETGDFKQVLNLAEKKADISGFLKRREADLKVGKLRGIGYCNYIEACGTGPGDVVDFKLVEGGIFEIYVGTQMNGQGHITAFTQVFSEVLSLPADKIRIIQGDSDLIKSSAGTGGSKALAETGSIVYNGSKIILEEGKKLTSEMLEVNIADLDYKEGEFIIKGTNKKVSWSEIENDLSSKKKNFVKTVSGKNKDNSYTNGCHIAEITITLATGDVKLEKYTVVDDLGFVVNETLAKGQIQGGVVQGLGQAKSELAYYDEDGQLLASSLMDYALPKADDIIDFDINFFKDEKCLNNILGVKGAGEAGTIAAPAAFVNAVLDALQVYDIDCIDMPVTSHKVWLAISNAKVKKAS